MVNIPDNFDFFEWEDQRREMLRSRLPKCDCCGEPMEEWYRIPQRDGDLLVCTDCAVKEYWED